MRHQNTVCHALLKPIPRYRFERLVERHGGDYRVRTLPCWSQLVAMIYAQLSGAQSLRELIAGLGSHRNLLYHLGVEKQVRRSTLSDANLLRPVALFADVFGLLLPGVGRGLRREAGTLVRLIDATALPLNELFSWAAVSPGYSGAKLHLIYDPEAQCPTYFALTSGRTNDIVIAKAMPLQPGATYVFDKGFYDFGWWNKLNQMGCGFVTRLKINTPVSLVEERPVIDPSIESDRLVRLNQRMARSRNNPYQAPLRELIVRTGTGKTLRLVTNDLDAPATRIAELYRTRWQIELFFKWIKQNLRIRKFLGTSENAVKLQVITALIAYLLIRLAQQACPATLSMQDLARLVRANLMHRKTIADLLRPPPLPPNPTFQLSLGIPHAA